MGDAHLDPGPIPPLKARLLGVLLDPRETFAHHDAAWGWLGPWLVVSLAGVLCGLLFLARIDVDAMVKAQNEAAFERMDPAQRKLIEGNPQAQEFADMGARAGAFLAKLGAVAGPPLGNLVGLVVAGGLLFGAARLGAGRPELTRCLSVAAHAQAVNLVAVAATGLAILTGNGQPTTSPANLVDRLAHPVAFAALSRLDPVAVLYYVAVAAGLERSLRVPRQKALQLTVGAFLALSLLTVALAAAAAALQGLGGGGR